MTFLLLWPVFLSIGNCVNVIVIKDLHYDWYFENSLKITLSLQVYFISLAFIQLLLFYYITEKITNLIYTHEIYTTVQIKNNNNLVYS